ncbi:basic proline-rich protein-like [Marmota monax]|uniref:basic proline-rich protein-like n=1 Tax=Marmota monax TaxID=9995 RepID=UPI001EAFE718|nr:basic proline-rich protein-like [Marmota monax]
MQPVAATARRSATAQRPPGPSEVPTRGAGDSPSPCCGFAPRPERARGAGPRGLGGRERGARAGGPVRQGTWAPAAAVARPLSFHASYGLTRVALPARGRRPPPPPLAAAARCPGAPLQPGRQARGTARGRARAPRSPRPPPPPTCRRRRRPLAPQPAYPPPASSRRFSVGKVARPLRGLPPRRRRRPFRPPRGKAQPAAPLFYLPGVFARALALSLAFPPLALVSFFLSFFSLAGAGAFSARAARACPLAPSFLLGSAEPGGRQLSPPPSTRAPAEAAAALRAPTHSNMARAQGACARAPPPRPGSAVLPAARAPRAVRVAPPRPGLPTPALASAGPARAAQEAKGRRAGALGSSASRRPRSRV